MVKIPDDFLFKIMLSSYCFEMYFILALTIYEKTFLKTAFMNCTKL